MTTNDRKAVVEAVVARLLSESSGLDFSEMDQRASFTELGFNSLFLIQFSQNIWSQLRVNVTFGQLIEDTPNIESLIDHITENLPQSTGRVRVCRYCRNVMSIGETSCPHCGRPQFFPNVDLAQLDSERQKLKRRFDAVVADAKTRDCELVLNRFRDACQKSNAVFRCTIERLHHQIGGETEVYATYYDLDQLRLNTHAINGVDWAKVRSQAETELLGDSRHANKIHYACLSIDGMGLGNYGDCIVQLSEPMIAHRASCFEGNTGVIYAVQGEFDDCLRSGWADRHLICVTALGDRLNSKTLDAEFASIVVQTGESSEDDSFIEVHVFGKMTARTFTRVGFVVAGHNETQKAYRKVLEQKLAAANVNTYTI